MDIDERMCLSPGAMLQGGKYRIESILGQGGFGITYLATQVSLGRKVAIKEFFMKEHCNRDTTSSFVSVGSQGSEDIVRRFREKFMKEALLIAGVEHKHIVRIIDTFEENGTAYYVMNYHANGSLQEYVKKNGALPEAKALNYTRQLCDALRHIHANNILHLDVKPGNIMIDNDGNLVLIDFGISKHYDEGGHQTTSTPVARSKGYAPFEQYIGGEMKKFTPATDIYSVAATLLYMLTATRPPEPDEISEMKATFPAKLLEGKGVSATTVAAIAAAMQVNKADRPQTIAAFLQLLNKPNEELVAEVDDSDDTIPETTKPKPTPAPKPNYLKYILGVLAVVLGVIIGVVLTNNDSAPEAVVAEEAVVDSTAVVEPGTTQREEQERLAEEQRKREQAEADRKQREEQERIAEEQRKQEEAARKQREEQERLAEEQRKREQAEADRKTREEQERIAEEQRKRNETIKRSGTINGHEWVDLGLSVKWATCNVGASQPHGYGNYYAWGETSTKSKYTSDNSRTHGKNMRDISGNSTYDVARSNWGGSWRLPTKREMEELKDKCTWTWTSQSGVKGYKVTGPNGNSIFLPAAGNCDWSSRNDVGEDGYYWSSTPNESYTDCAYYLRFDSGCHFVYWINRFLGRTVRPVSE